VPNNRRLNPFLMLDHFHVSEGGGFPDHPHTNITTITLMKRGKFAHEDFTGAAGTIGPNDLQIMHANRGIVHSEIPVGNKAETADGMQLWVAVPKEYSNKDPQYRDLRDPAVPHAKPDDKVDIRVISGESYGVEAAKSDIPVAYTPILYLDVAVKKGGKVTQPIPEGWNAFIYIMDGNAVINGTTKAKKLDNVVFKQDGTDVEISNESDEDLTFILLAGKPVDQEVHQYGPFVASSRQGLQQCFENYQTATNGFERARGFKSKIGEEFLQKGY